jgi:hypothetical protein
MSVEGIILHHGEAGGVTLHQIRVDYLLTAEHSKQCSVFEFSIAPGFNTGAHYHTRSRSCSTFSRARLICVAANGLCTAGRSASIKKTAATLCPLIEVNRPLLSHRGNAG